MQLHSATAVEAARSTVRGIPRMPVLCTVPYPASYAQYRSLKKPSTLFSDRVVKNDRSMVRPYRVLVRTEPCATVLVLDLVPETGI